MIAAEIARYLNGLGLVSYSATANTGDVFINRLPPKPDSIVYIREYGGPPPDAALGYDTRALQIIVRGATEDSREVETRALQLYNALHAAHSMVLLDGTTVIDCLAQQSPYSLGVDANQRHEYCFNLYVEVRNNAGNRE